MVNLLRITAIFFVLTSSAYASLTPQDVVCTGQISNKYSSIRENSVRNIHIDFSNQMITVFDARSIIQKQIRISNNEIDFNIASYNSNFINSHSKNWVMTFPHSRNSSDNYVVPSSGGLFYLNATLLPDLVEGKEVVYDIYCDGDFK